MSAEMLSELIPKRGYFLARPQTLSRVAVVQCREAHRAADREPQALR